MLPNPGENGWSKKGSEVSKREKERAIFLGSAEPFV